MNKKMVIFDLDGTLVETSKSILNSFRYVERKMNLPHLIDSNSHKLMGLPLKQIYSNYYNLDSDKCVQAIALYRSRYNRYCKREVYLYDNTIETLEYLKNKNYILNVCTLKREDLAIKILKHLNIYKYFNRVYGIDNNDTLSKVDLINKCLDNNKLENNKVILIGDSMSDINASIETKIDIILACYGHGIIKIRESNVKNYLDEINSFYEIKTIL